jgi:hypothetical protein
MAKAKFITSRDLAKKASEARERRETAVKEQRDAAQERNKASLETHLPSDAPSSLAAQIAKLKTVDADQKATLDKLWAEGKQHGQDKLESMDEADIMRRDEEAYAALRRDVDGIPRTVFPNHSLSTDKVSHDYEKVPIEEHRRRPFQLLYKGVDRTSGTDVTQPEWAVNEFGVVQGRVFINREAIAEWSVAPFSSGWWTAAHNPYVLWGTPGATTWGYVRVEFSTANAQNHKWSFILSNYPPPIDSWNNLAEGGTGTNPGRIIIVPVFKVAWDAANERIDSENVRIYHEGDLHIFRQSHSICHTSAASQTISTSWVVIDSSYTKWNDNDLSPRIEEAQILDDGSVPALRNFQRAMVYFAKATFITGYACQVGTIIEVKVQYFDPGAWADLPASNYFVTLNPRIDASSGPTHAVYTEGKQSVAIPVIIPRDLNRTDSRYVRLQARTVAGPDVTTDPACVRQEAHLLL